MKKLHSMMAFAAIAVLALSCQKENTPQKQGRTYLPEEMTVTACVPQTKVAYSEDSTTGNLKPSWEVGDEIFGFTASNAVVSFSVESVDDATGVATLAQSTSVSLSDNEAVHVIYCPAKSASDLADGTLAIDFSSQSAGSLPVVMLSDATVSGGVLNFQFRNAVSVLGIVDPVVPVNTTDGRTLTKVVVSGHGVVSNATVALDGDALSLVCDVPSKFLELSLADVAFTAIDAENATFDDPLYIVLPPCGVQRVTFVDSKRNIRSIEVNKTTVASKYYCLENKSFEKITLPEVNDPAFKAGGVTWAKMNFGATKATGTGVTAFGELYQWGATELIYSDKTASAFTFKSGFEDGFTEHEGYFYYSGGAYTKYNETDDIRVLDPVDDPVQLAYPGSGWRMPTNSEIEDIIADESITSSFASSYATLSNGTASTSFLRAATGGKDTAYGVTGTYWTSTVNRSNYLQGKVFKFNKSGVMSSDVASRRQGLPIRPVKEPSK